MNFQFENFQDFIHMSGHGSFVWACYLITLLTIIALLIIPGQQKKSLRQQMQRQQRIDRVEPNHL